MEDYGEEEPVDDEEQEQQGANTVLRKNKEIEAKVWFTDAEAETTIAEFMEKNNRPFSVQNMLDNFQG